MKFALIDRIIELAPAQRITAVKAVTLAEEYLADHFPTFPVLPGVLMLECLVEAATWLVHDAQSFTHSVILLREARNVTYKSFVKPGSILRVEVTCRKLSDNESDFEGTGYCQQDEVLKARFGLRHFSLAAKGDDMLTLDAKILRDARSRFAILRS